jgi:hypothetical protein
MSVMNSYFIYQSISANFQQTVEALEHLFRTKKARKPAQHTLATSIPPAQFYSGLIEMPRR